MRNWPVSTGKDAQPLLTRATMRHSLIKRLESESQTGEQSEGSWILTQGGNVKQSGFVHKSQPGCKMKEKLKHDRASIYTPPFRPPSFLTVGTRGKRNEQRSSPIPIMGEHNCGLVTQQNTVHRAQGECLLLIYHMEEPRKPRASGVSQSQRLDTTVLTHVRNRVATTRKLTPARRCTEDRISFSDKEMF